MNTFYLICFILGLTFSVLSVFTGGGHLHLGHFGHFHVGHAPVGRVHAGGGHPVINGFTVAAFLCWFGGVGYLLHNYSSWLTPLVLIAALAAGLAGASIFYALLFKLLLPREQILSAEDTRMDGVLARVSDGIRAGGGTGEILFTQTGARRGAAARSENGIAIPRGTEVVVLRYEHGIAYVSPLNEFSEAPVTHSGASRNSGSM
jgi:hypothetical protein